MISTELSFGLEEDWAEAAATGGIALEIVGAVKKERGSRSEGGLNLKDPGGIISLARTRLVQSRVQWEMSSDPQLGESDSKSICSVTSW